MNEPDLVAWLQQHGERIGLDAESRAQLVCLANLNRGDLASVAADLIERWELQVDESEEWFDRGNKLIGLGKYEEAIASYKQVIKISPKIHRAWHNRGVATSNLGRYEEAIASYEKAIKINRYEHTTWSNKSVSIGNLHGYKSQINAYKESMSSSLCQ